MGIKLPQHCSWLWSTNINLMHCSYTGSLSLRSSNINCWSAWQSTHLHDHKSTVMWMPFLFSLRVQAYWSRPEPYQYDYSELWHDNRFKCQQSNCRSYGHIWYNLVLICMEHALCAIFFASQENNRTGKVCSFNLTCVE